MRKKIVAGNWKMNLTQKDSLVLCQNVNQIANISDVQIVIFPPMLYVQDCLRNAEHIQVGAQNGFHKDMGAFTGEVSMLQLKDAGVSAVLVGHSERREFFGETNALLKLKVDAALTHQLTPFFCCGEPLEERENGTYFLFVKKQLEESIFHLSADEFAKIVIAYEPIWAIGTGKTASSEQAEEMHAAIRSWIEKQYGESIAQSISILYGGSCNPSNAKSLFACPNVDGGLIGGASLKVEDFSVLVAKETWTI